MRTPDEKRETQRLAMQRLRLYGRRARRATPDEGTRSYVGSSIHAWDDEPARCGRVRLGGHGPAS